MNDKKIQVLKIYLRVILKSVSSISNTWMIKKFQVLKILKVLPIIVTKWAPRVCLIVIGESIFDIFRGLFGKTLYLLLNDLNWF